MTTNGTLHPAEERLLDAALDQVFVERRLATAPRRDARSPLVAAFVLLGLGVVVTVAWLARSPSRSEAQEPAVAPMPPEVEGDERAGIEALPVTTENLFAKFVDPRELPSVGRFPGLRRLRLWPEKTTILGISTGAYHGKWKSPPADLLQPIAKLERLEVLWLPHELGGSPELLAPLAGHPSLRELQFVQDGFTIDERLVAALAAIPKLRSLHFHFVPVNSTVLHHLASLPLRSLEFEHGSGLDAAGWGELLTMRSLERLAFEDWNWPRKTTKAGDAEWRPDADDLGRLRELPRLRHLELRYCAIDDEQFAALPETLTTLRFAGTQLTPDGIGALRRFVALRELDFDTKTGGLRTIGELFAPEPEAAAEAVAAALPSLRLRKLAYGGALTTALADAIGAQRELRDVEITSKTPAPDLAARLFAKLPVERVVWRAPVTATATAALAKRPDLRELALHCDAISSLAPLADAPRLERLVLSENRIANGIAAGVLAALAASRSLRDIDVHVTVIRGEPHPSEAELQKAVGDRIRLRLHESEQTVKR